MIPSTNLPDGYTNMAKKNIPTADFSAFAAPVQKLIELNTATMTKAFELQKAAAEKQMAQSQASLQAVLQVKDAETLAAFVSEQSEVAKANFEALQADAQAASESAQAYFAEVQAILAESQAAAVKAATPKKG